VSEKAFRLDFFIAIAALLVSAISAVALLYQTRVNADQYAATIWPYLSITETYTPGLGEVLTLDNEGVGPALIRSAQLSVDGKPVSGWGDYFSVLLHDPDVRRFFRRLRSAALAGKGVTPSISNSSLGPGSTLRSGESRNLLVMNVPGFPFKALMRAPLTIDLCYCSLNKSCWTLHSDQSKPSAASDPVPVAACGTTAMILAPTNIVLFNGR
jgi:hypothetical protein